IPRDQVPRVTERFYRVDPGRSRASGGTGLGLAIVKHALQRHGGSLGIESREGEGSTFTCRFPASRIARRGGEAARGASARAVVLSGLEPRFSRRGARTMEVEDLGHHISRRFNEDLERVRNSVLTMGGLVEDQLDRAMRALAEADSELGLQVAE